MEGIVVGVPERWIYGWYLLCRTCIGWAEWRFFHTSPAFPIILMDSSFMLANCWCITLPFWIIQLIFSFHDSSNVGTPCTPQNSHSIHIIYATTFDSYYPYYLFKFASLHTLDIWSCEHREGVGSPGSPAAVCWDHDSPPVKPTFFIYAYM